MPLLKKIPYFFFILIGFSCTKVLNEVKLIVPQSETIQTTVNTPVAIDYRVEGDHIDSVSLIINGAIFETQIVLKNQFVFYPEEVGEYHLQIYLFYASGLEKMSSIVKVYSSGFNQPNISFDITSIQGYEPAYINDELLISPVLITNGYDISNCQEMNIVFNGEDLGTQTQAPFEFKTPIIAKEVNSIKINYVEEEGGQRTYETITSFWEMNEIKLDFYFPSYKYASKLHFYRDPIEVKVFTWADTGVDIEKLELYIDNELTQSIDTHHASNYNELVNLGSLEKGNHEVYSIVYDNRGRTKQSETLYFRIENMEVISHYSELFDYTLSVKSNRVYAISNTTLFVIDPIEEKVEQTISLYSNIIGMDYMAENEKIYYATKSGDIMSWDENTMQIQVVNTSLFSNINDIVADGKHQLLYIIDNGKLCAYNLNTNSSVICNIDLQEKSFLAYDEENEIIIAGGDKIWNKDIYKIKFTQNAFEEIDNARFVSNIREILVNPMTQNIIIRTGGISSNTVWDMENFGNQIIELDVSSPRSVAFSSDYSEIALGMDYDHGVNFFDAETYGFVDQCVMSTEYLDDTPLLIPTQDPKKWIVYIHNTIYPSAKFVFINRD